jgi:hypothetical protein
LLEFSDSLKKITKIAFSQKQNDTASKIKSLGKSIQKISKSKINNISKIYYYMEECKKKGTLAFAGLARCGFIAIDILNSLVENKVLSSLEKNKFLNSIKNVASKVNSDFETLSKNNFCKINGHLKTKQL